MTLFIRLLGTAEISHNDTPLQLKGHKPLALLAYLLITGKAHTRQHLVDLLYDEADDPRASLRWTLNQLRQTIGSDYLEADREQIGFNFESDYWLDLEAFSAGETELYRGEFLEGLYVRDAQRFMDWAFFERERMRDEYQRNLAHQLEEDENKGEYQSVVHLGHQLLRLDNLREEWYRALIQAYALLGNREAALAQYEVCRRVLGAELGIEPDEETTTLYEQIQAGTLTDPRSLADIPIQFPSFLKKESAIGVATPPAFVAREQELERLNQLLQQALSGQGQVAFVIGGAGRGKTALLAEFARQAQVVHANLLVAMGNCNAYSGIGDPYLPFRDMMGMLTGDVEAKLAAGTITLEHARRLWTGLLSICQALLEHGRNLIDVLVSQRELLARVKAAMPRSASKLEQLRRLVEYKEATMSNIAQEYLFQQLTNVLRALAERGPLLIFLDDLQWADTTSLSLLFHLGRRLGGSRILIVGAYRPEEVAIGRNGERHPVEKLLVEFKRTFGDVWVDLGQTGETENQQLVEMILNVEPNQLGSAFRRALYRHTSGHPLFTIELLKAMQERGDLVRDEQGQWVEKPSLNWEHLPARVEAVIEERIGRLEEELRQILIVASVDGEEFTAQVVARVQTISERHLLDQLSQALARKHRLVRGGSEIQIGDQILSRYQFVHFLFQRYLYNELSPGERRLLHSEIGVILETLYGEHSREIAVQLAHHFQEANIPEKARQYLRQAGKRAARQYANDEAVMYFSRALDMTPKDDLAERYTLLLAREKVYDLQGKRKAQSQDLTALQELVASMADDQRRAEVALRQANHAHMISDYLSAIAAAQSAINLAQVSQTISLEAAGYLQYGISLISHGDYQAARTQLEQTLALARAAHLRQAEGDSLCQLGFVSWNQSNYAESRIYGEQALVICREIGDRRGEGWLLNVLGLASEGQGDYAQSRIYYEQSLLICREIGDRLGESWVLNNLGNIAAITGNYSERRIYYEQSLLICREIGDREGEGGSLNNLGLICYDLGDPVSAMAYYEQALHIEREIGDRRGESNTLNNMGLVCFHLGDYANKGIYYEQALHIIQEIGDRLGESVTLGNVNSLSHHLGDNKAAREYSQQALFIAQELGDRNGEGYALTTLGHALTGLGYLAEAVDVYQQALVLRRELGQHNLAMESLAGLARVSVAQGYLAQALAQVEEILNHLEPNTLDGTEEPFRIYLTCYHVLRINQDPRAQAILDITYDLLQERAAKISDESLRGSFLENVATHREIVKEFNKKDANC